MTDTMTKKLGNDAANDAGIPLVREGPEGGRAR
jgi:hypothetical protein